MTHIDIEARQEHIRTLRRSAENRRALATGKPPLAGLFARLFTAN